ncbi:MAG: SDR family NAD(P)-dependent oxidoreductase [Thermoanaerobaculia bacterium]|nr:SDR family NAD(P)-dependent oxidoreductase [Thermoanaerobaculia bacterium]
MKTILISGGTGDLGSIVVPRMLREYRCVVLYRSESSWDKLKNAAKSKELIGMRESDGAKLEPLYAVVNLAGGFGPGGTVTDFEKLFEMNVLAAAATINLALPHLMDGGRIVAISSAVSLTRPAGLAAYAASKAALNAYIETLAKELKDRHITANALLPTTLDSSSAAKSAERLVKRENVAEMIALLLSEQGSNITGQLIGMSA